MYLKRPTKWFKGYYLIGNDGKRVHDPRIDKVNADLKAGEAPDLIEARMRAIKKSLEPTIELAVTNLRLVEDRHKWKLKYKSRNVNPEGLKCALISSAEAVGLTPIREASADQLLEALVHLKDQQKRYWIIRGLNELLRHAKRDFTLPNPKPQRPDEIEFIRIADFKEKASAFKPEVAAYLGALFATGCRWGELPAAKLSLTEARIKTQIDDEGIERLPKNKKGRTAPILPPLVDYVTKFKQLSKEEVLKIRLTGHTGVYRACRKILGIRIHSLRHSYAVEWGVVGSSTAEIARYIGDTEKVCEDHYRNFCATPDEIMRALKRWG